MGGTMILLIFWKYENQFSSVQPLSRVRFFATPWIAACQAAATGTLSAAERCFPTSEVRGRSREDPMPEGRRPRGATPCPRSGAEAGRTPCLRGGGRKVLPHVLRSGTVAESAGSDSAGTAERRYPMSEVSGGGWEELPHN